MYIFRRNLKVLCPESRPSKFSCFSGNTVIRVFAVQQKRAEYSPVKTRENKLRRFERVERKNIENWVEKIGEIRKIREKGKSKKKRMKIIRREIWEYKYVKYMLERGKMYLTPPVWDRGGQKNNRQTKNT